MQSKLEDCLDAKESIKLEEYRETFYRENILKKLFEILPFQEPQIAMDEAVGRLAGDPALDWWVHFEFLAPGL